MTHIAVSSFFGEAAFFMPVSKIFRVVFTSSCLILLFNYSSDSAWFKPLKSQASHCRVIWVEATETLEIRSNVG